MLNLNTSPTMHEDPLELRERRKNEGRKQEVEPRNELPIRGLSTVVL
jgi:hypothetical protein